MKKSFNTYINIFWVAIVSGIAFLLVAIFADIESPLVEVGCWIMVCVCACIFGYSAWKAGEIVDRHATGTYTEDEEDQ